VIVRKHRQAVAVFAISRFAHELEFIALYQTEFFAYLHKPFKIDNLKMAGRTAVEQDALTPCGIKGGGVTSSDSLPSGVGGGVTSVAVIVD